MVVILLKQIVIIGTNKIALKCLEVISSITNMKIVAIVKVDEATDAISLARTLGIRVESTLDPWLNEAIDYIFETTGIEKIKTTIDTLKYPNTMNVKESLLQMITPVTNYFSYQVHHLEIL